MKTEAWYFTHWNVLEVRWQAGQVGYNEGRPNPLSSTQNELTEIEILSTSAKTDKFEKKAWISFAHVLTGASNFSLEIVQWIFKP